MSTAPEASRPIVLRARWSRSMGLWSAAVAVALLVTALVVPGLRIVLGALAGVLAVVALVGFGCWWFQRVELTHEALECHLLPGGDRFPVGRIDRVELAPSGAFQVLQLVVGGEPRAVNLASTRDDMERNLAVVGRWLESHRGPARRRHRSTARVGDQVLRQGPRSARSWLWLAVALVLTVALGVEQATHGVLGAAWVASALAIAAGAWLWWWGRREVRCTISQGRLVIGGARPEAYSGDDVARIVTLDGGRVALHATDGRQRELPVPTRLPDGELAGPLLQRWAEQHRGGRGGGDPRKFAVPKQWLVITVQAVAATGIGMQLANLLQPHDPARLIALPAVALGLFLSQMVRPDRIAIDWSTHDSFPDGGAGH